MRPSDCEIFFSSLRSRSRVRSSSACSSSIVARSAGSGTIEVSSRRCSVVSPALLSRSSLSACSLTRKNSSCFSFMYSDSGMASSSASVRSRPALVFQALASFGSALCAWRGVSCSRLFICRVGGRGGANRSANRDVGGGSGAAPPARRIWKRRARASWESAVPGRRPWPPGRRAFPTGGGRREGTGFIGGLVLAAAAGGPVRRAPRRVWHLWRWT